MADNAVKKTDGTCPDGYSEVWVWCIKKTVVNKLTDPLANISLPDLSFTDVSCESALAAMKTLNKSLQSALEAPTRYMNLLKNLVNYPFDVASDLVSSALSAIDAVNQALASAMSAPNDLRNALQSLLNCPLISDTDIGKLAASALDALNAGSGISNALNALKNSLNSTANELLNSLKDTPLDAINNLRNAYNNLLERSGISDLVSLLKQIEQCVEQLCAAYASTESFINRLPTSSDSLLSSAGAAFDSATGKVKQIATSTVTNTSSKLLNAANTVSSLVTLKS